MGLKNPENLNENYSAKLDMILLHNRRLATAYRLKEELRLIFKLPSEEVSAAIDKWRRRAWSCRIPQFGELQRKIKRHKKAIIAAITLGLSNARIETTNNKIKLSIRMSYGFRNLEPLRELFITCHNFTVYAGLRVLSFLLLDVDFGLFYINKGQTVLTIKLHMLLATFILRHRYLA